MVLRTWRFAILFFLINLAHAQSITGTWEHVRDSDGTKPKDGMTMSLTFDANGKCHLKATDDTGKNQNVSGDGTYKVTGTNISISLPVLELNIANKPFTLRGSELSLPFLLFNEGNGTSVWTRPWDASTVGPPPPIPEDQKGDVNKPAPPPPPPPHPVGGGMDDELLCTCSDKQYGTPGEALRNCTRPSLAKPMCGVVLTQQKQSCPALRNVPDFAHLYDTTITRQVQRGLGPGLTTTGYTPLLRSVITTFYKQVNVNEWNFVIEQGDPKEMELARTEKEYGSKPYKLIAKVPVFYRSPAGLTSSIGHELIHGEQWKRTLPYPNYPGLKPVVDALKELEAYSWESGASDFNWSIGPNKMWNCMTTKERDMAEAVRSCREWQVREELVAVNTSSSTDPAERRRMIQEKQAYFADWISKDPWANTVWRRKNAGWRNITDHDSDSIVPFRHNRKMKIDCNQGVGANTK